MVFFTLKIVSCFLNFLWPQAWSLNPLPEVYTLFEEGGGIKLVNLASGTAFTMCTVLDMRPIHVWRSRTHVGVRCAHFPSDITTTVNGSGQMV
jgi:hypothetical protein